MPKPSIIIWVGRNWPESDSRTKRNCWRHITEEMPEKCAAVGVAMPSPEIVKAMAKSGVAADSAEFESCDRGSFLLRITRSFMAYPVMASVWKRAAGGG